MNSSAPTTLRSMAVKALPRHPAIPPTLSALAIDAPVALSLTVSQADNPLQARNPTARSGKGLRVREFRTQPPSKWMITAGASSKLTSLTPFVGLTWAQLAGSKISLTSSFCPLSNPETRARMNSLPR